VKKENHFEDLDLDGIITLKLIQMQKRGLDLFGSGKRHRMGPCDYVNESSG
jgi:hypothetical protein